MVDRLLEVMIKGQVSFATCLYFTKNGKWMISDFSKVLSLPKREKEQMENWEMIFDSSAAIMSTEGY